MPDHSIAPWTAAEVASLNAFQASGVMHPFTCGSDDEPPCNSVLVATSAGWECPECDYRQNWAHAWMADGSWRDAFPVHPLAARILAPGDQVDECPDCGGPRIMQAADCPDGRPWCGVAHSESQCPACVAEAAERLEPASLLRRIEALETEIAELRNPRPVTLVEFPAGATDGQIERFEQAWTGGPLKTRRAGEGNDA